MLKSTKYMSKRDLIIDSIKDLEYIFSFKKQEECSIDAVKTSRYYYTQYLKILIVYFPLDTAVDILEILLDTSLVVNQLYESYRTHISVTYYNQLHVDSPYLRFLDTSSAVQCIYTIDNYMAILYESSRLQIFKWTYVTLTNKCLLDVYHVLTLNKKPYGFLYSTKEYGFTYDLYTYSMMPKLKTIYTPLTTYNYMSSLDRYSCSSIFDRTNPYSVDISEYNHVIEEECKYNIKINKVKKSSLFYYQSHFSIQTILKYILFMHPKNLRAVSNKDFWPAKAGVKSKLL